MNDLMYVGEVEKNRRRYPFNLYLNKESEYTPIIMHDEDAIGFPSPRPRDKGSTYHNIFDIRLHFPNILLKSYNHQYYAKPFGGLIEFNHFFNFKVMYFILVHKSNLDYQIKFIKENNRIDYRFAQFHVSEKAYDTSLTTPAIRTQMKEIENEVRRKLMLPVIVRPDFKDLFWQPELPKDLSAVNEWKERYKNGESVFGPREEVSASSYNFYRRRTFSDSLAGMDVTI